MHVRTSNSSSCSRNDGENILVQYVESCKFDIERSVHRHGHVVKEIQATVLKTKKKRR